MLHKVIGLENGPATCIQWQSVVITLCIRQVTSRRGMSHFLAVRCSSVRLQSAVSQTCWIYTYTYVLMVNSKTIGPMLQYPQTLHQTPVSKLWSGLYQNAWVIWRPVLFILNVDISWQMKPGLISWKEVKWFHRSFGNNVHEPFTVGHNFSLSCDLSSCTVTWPDKTQSQIMEYMLTWPSWRTCLLW